MEAGNTVMTHSELIQYCRDKVGLQSFAPHETDRIEAQAAISFKAGQKEGFILSKVTDPVLLSKTEHEELNRRAKAFLDDVRQEGIKEVVEWIKASGDASLYTQCGEYTDEWQAKLKEWGVE